MATAKTSATKKVAARPVVQEVIETAVVENKVKKDNVNYVMLLIRKRHL